MSGFGGRIKRKVLLFLLLLVVAITCYWYLGDYRKSLRFISGNYERNLVLLDRYFQRYYGYQIEIKSYQESECFLRDKQIVYKKIQNDGQEWLETRNQESHSRYLYTYLHEDCLSVFMFYNNLLDRPSRIENGGRRYGFQIEAVRSVEQCQSLQILFGLNERGDYLGSIVNRSYSKELDVFIQLDRYDQRHRKVRSQHHLDTIKQQVSNLNCTSYYQKRSYPLKLMILSAEDQSNLYKFSLNLLIFQDPPIVLYHQHSTELKKCKPISQIWLCDEQHSAREGHRGESQIDEQLLIEKVVAQIEISPQGNYSPDLRFLTQISIDSVISITQNQATIVEQILAPSSDNPEYQADSKKVIQELNSLWIQYVSSVLSELESNKLIHFAPNERINLFTPFRESRDKVLNNSPFRRVQVNFTNSH